MPPSTKQFSGIFISYRRDDSAGHAGRLSDKLSDHFGKDQIFMDIDNVQPGEDFVQVIEDAVGSCEILIAIIGRHWLSDAGQTSRWLDDPNDFVRLEIAAALNRDIRIIPVPVQGATMPKPQDLPEDLTKLSRRNALEITNTRWQRDVDQLINAIEKIREDQGKRRAADLVSPLPQPILRAARSNRPLLIVAAVFIAAIVIAAALFGGILVWTTKQHDPENANGPSGTNESQTEKQNSPVPPTGTADVPGGESRQGTIAGEIIWAGAGPTPRKIDTSSDPVCSHESPDLMTEDNLVRGGKLANVFVYVKEGTTVDGQNLRDLSFDVPASEVVLDQKGCRFVPHVLGLQVNQRLKISNSDPTQHNIHPTPRANPEWNQTQPSGAASIEKSFSRAEILVPVKCNQHPWMKAYIGVLKHPFFAVSGEDGRFKIGGVPPGTYTVAAWYEKGGPNGTEKTTQVTVNPQRPSSVRFRFGMAIAAGLHPSLEMIPAIEVLNSVSSDLRQH